MKAIAGILLLVVVFFPSELGAQGEGTPEKRLAVLLEKEGFVPNLEAANESPVIQSYKKSVGTLWLVANITKNPLNGRIGIRLIFPQITAYRAQLDLVCKAYAALANREKVFDFEAQFLGVFIRAAGVKNGKITDDAYDEYLITAKRTSEVREIAIEQIRRSFLASVR